MSEPVAVTYFSKQSVYSQAVIASGMPNISLRGASEELPLVKHETSCAVVLLQSFRDRASINPKADLKAAFDHIDNALTYSRGLRMAAVVNDADDHAMLHLSMQYFQTVLSDIPQVSFLSSCMIDSFLEIKDELIETRKMLVPVRM